MSHSPGRILSVRLTQEQYDLLQALLRTEGGRNVSDVARHLLASALQIPRPASANVQDALVRLDSILSELQGEIRTISALCKPRDD